MSIPKKILQAVAFSIIFSSIGAGSDAPKSPTFTLPNELTQWQTVTNAFMAPVLKTQALKETWQELVDLTMPLHGNFDPIHKERREKTIIYSFVKMSTLNEDDSLVFLKGVYKRHQEVYVPKS